MYAEFSYLQAEMEVHDGGTLPVPGVGIVLRIV